MSIDHIAQLWLYPKTRTKKMPWCMIGRIGLNFNLIVLLIENCWNLGAPRMLCPGPCIEKWNHIKALTIWKVLLISFCFVITITQWFGNLALLFPLSRWRTGPSERWSGWLKDFHTLVSWWAVVWCTVLSSKSDIRGMSFPNGPLNGELLSYHKQWVNSPTWIGPWVRNILTIGAGD